LEPAEDNLTPYSLAFDPQNHDRLLTGYMPSPSMTLWDMNRTDSYTFRDPGSGPVWRVAFDRKGEFVAAGSNDAVVRLWPTDGDRTGEARGELRGHHASIFSVDVSLESIASGSMDGTIRLWTRDAPLSAKLLSRPASMPSTSDKFTVEGSQIFVTSRDGKNYSGTLPEKFGEVGAAAVSANGAGIVVVPRGVGQPVLLVELRDDRIKISVPLNGLKSEWTGAAFIENDTLIAARTKDGRIFAWPFYSDVRSVQELAQNHLPLLRGEDGSDRRLEGDAFILRQTVR
jgi:hypothetical protein